MLKALLSWLRGVLLDLVTQAASTPKYSATTKASSVATTEQKTAVKQLIKGSKLWEEKHRM